jgi:hypothetical protein
MNPMPAAFLVGRKRLIGFISKITRPRRLPDIEAPDTCGQR